MQLFFTSNITGDILELDQEESKHLIKVLRKSQGDPVHFTDGHGNLFHCRIVEANPKKAVVRIESSEYHPEDDYHIHLAISPTKNADRMEWMIEKLTEIGVHEITFMESDFSERSHLKLERLEKKIVAACKQSIKTRLPLVNPQRPLKDLIKDEKFNDYQRFIAYVDKENDTHLFARAHANQSYLILIGPEGDFSPQEIKLAFDNHFIPCSLGKSRLRSETAAVAAVHTLQIKNHLKNL
ncbi:16S rRNA (uracil(1498)-N(3))-methyltransferase [Belliella kenyensis]|uniref:Ribosomal RNA small subunit methyltransferase E n=1 Tax=Belliella kenyensis TaxID=1472724 RepID=A0ABV8ERB1_9BACT|nr:16S rRNA (uracil(1498)-N(3))-methyltransferase [Belliella kenyensis]MCH7403383.1 16S rRNA (uracil(1498)-N(3))-methyltransferase [Belliella kenyensis]MDN3601595.1 16S rRNA (uracil(1498)-N(3))-methyltransferase [Belliella kenyensis]